MKAETPHSKQTEKNVALALSSGGARGLAHIGAIEELEARGYRIGSIAGCSMGALIGGVYAAGKLTEFRSMEPLAVARLYAEESGRAFDEDLEALFSEVVNEVKENERNA